MSIWELVGLWPVRALVIGGGVLLCARLLLLVVRQPSRRIVVGIAAALVALLAVPLSMLPGWWSIAFVPESPSVRAQGASSTPTQEHAQTARPTAIEDPTLHPEPAPPLVVAAEVAWQPPITAMPRNEVEEAPTPAHEPNTERELHGLTVPVPTVPSGWEAWGSRLLALYGIIVCVLIGRLLHGQRTLTRWWRAARPAPSDVQAAFDAMATTMCPTAELRVAPIPGPVCFGFWRPRVLLPEPLAVDANHDTLRCIFAHELGHLRRRDPLAAWLMSLVRSVYFLCPWWLGVRRQVRLAQEYLADADAVRVARSPADYAELLLQMIRPRIVPCGAVGVRGTTSDLYRRVTMLLRNSGTVEQRCPRRWAWAIGGGLTALAVAVGGVSVQPVVLTAAPEEKSDAPTKDQQIETLKKSIEKLSKELGPDNETVKILQSALEQMERNRAEKGRPLAPPVGGGGVVAPPIPPVVPPPPGAFPPAPIAPPIIIGNGFGGEDLPKELLEMQNMMRKQMEEMMRLSRMRAGLGGGNLGGFGLAGPGSASQGRLGIRIERPTDALVAQLDLPSGKGLVCADVPAESVAGKAGIKPHDILLEVDGKAISSDGNEFINSLKGIKPDQAVDIVVLRKGRKETIKGVKLPEAKVMEQPRFAPLPPFPVPNPIIINQPLPGGNNIVITNNEGESFRVERVDDAFTIFVGKNGVKLTITGSKEEAGPKAESLELEVGGKTTKYDAIDKLPKEYQEMAQRALKSIK